MTEIDKKMYEIFADKTLVNGCLIRQDEFDYEFNMPEDESDITIAIKN